MASNDKKTGAYSIGKSLGWLVEMAFRLVAGYVLVVGVKHNYITLAVGIYALVTGTAILLMHFVKAHK